MSVRRIYVEKRQDYAVKAKELKDELKTYLGISGIDSIRILIRYDMENISDEIYKKALVNVFSEPPVDNYYEEKIELAKEDRVFTVEYMPGQFDQRADSAVQCIKLLESDVEVLVKNATTYIVSGHISDDEFEQIKAYCVNPVDSRIAEEEKPDNLFAEFETPADVEYLKDFYTMSLDDFKSYMEQGCIDEAVGIAIATRPDCIADEYLEILADIRDRFQKDIYIELGLQTVNYETLEKINRGHDLAQFIDAVLRIKRYGFNITTHMIVNLPWDTMKDTIEGARILSALGVDQVKLHALYIVKNTLMAKWYQEGQFTLISAEEYADRVVNFVRHLHPDIVLQRLVGRAPEDNTLFTNWSMGWWRVQDLIDDKLDELDAYQGDLCDYLNGKAVRKFID